MGSLQEGPGFWECDICSKKPGSPDLCAACLHNRTLIERLQEQPRASLPKMQATDIRARACSLAIQASPVLGIKDGGALMVEAEKIEKWLRDAPG